MNQRLFLLVLTCAFVAGCAQTTTWQGRIVSKTAYPLSAMVNPQKGPYSILQIDGKRFEHVLGFSPYYLNIPGANAIVFVVFERNATYTCHIFDMERHQDVAIYLNYHGFGGNICNPNCPATVEKSDGNTIILTEPYCLGEIVEPNLRGLVMSKRQNYLDLERKQVVKAKIIYFDQSGVATGERDITPR